MFSIIIPCKNKEEAEFCIKKCKELNHLNFEILVIDDNIFSGVPAKKRDYGAIYAKGDILAFIDSDAYPPKDWLRIAERYITDYALGGPCLLPLYSSFKERITDQIYSWLPCKQRIRKTKPMFVREMTSANLFVRTNRFWEVGGFNWDYLTGEDTFLCHKLGGCLYVPELIVYHRRREVIKPLLRQIANYGYHRGLLLHSYIASILTYGINVIKGFFR